jgi:hypothetical protein
MGGKLDDEESPLELYQEEEEKEGEVMTTRGRKARSTSPAAIAKREKYAADKAAKLAALNEPTNIPIETPLDNAGSIEVEITPNEAPKLSLKDRLFGGVAQPGAPTKAKTVKKGQRGKQIDASLLAKTFPTMVASIVTNYSQKLIRDPYKPCAPSQQEVLGTIGPLFSILSRRVEIVGTASEDIIDLISSILAGLVAGVRIHITYLSIAEAIEKAKLNGHASNSSVNAGRGQSIPVTGRESQLDTSREDSLLTGLVVRTDSSDGDGYADLADGDSINAKPEAALFTELAKRDRAGRVRLGLL